MDAASKPESPCPTALDLIREINRPVEKVANLLYLARHTNEPEEQRDYFLRLAEEEVRAISGAMIRYQRLWAARPGE